MKMPSAGVTKNSHLLHNSLLRMAGNTYDEDEEEGDDPPLVLFMDANVNSSSARSRSEKDQNIIAGEVDESQLENLEQLLESYMDNAELNDSSKNESWE